MSNVSSFTCNLLIIFLKASPIAFSALHTHRVGEPYQRCSHVVTSDRSASRWVVLHAGSASCSRRPRSSERDRCIGNDSFAPAHPPSTPLPPTLPLPESLVEPPSHYKECYCVSGRSSFHPVCDGGQGTVEKPFTVQDRLCPVSHSPIRLLSLSFAHNVTSSPI